jgi:hypothetical protein
LEEDQIDFFFLFFLFLPFAESEDHLYSPRETDGRALPNGRHAPSSK